MILEKKLIKLTGFFAIFGTFAIVGSLKFFLKQSLFDGSSLNRDSIERYDDVYVNISLAEEDLSKASFCKHPTIHEFPYDFLPFQEYKYGSKFSQKLAVININIKHFKNQLRVNNPLCNNCIFACWSLNCMR